MLAHFQSGPLPLTHKNLVAPTTTTLSTMEMPGYGYVNGMMDHHQQLQQQYQTMPNYHNSNNTFIQQQYVAPQPAPASCSRKRKADSQPENNERLSKRMSLLNLGMFPPLSPPPLSPLISYHISDITLITTTSTSH